MATIRVGDSTTMYYKDWGEGPFVAFRTASVYADLLAFLEKVERR